ncbi:MAG: hypothetical protein Q4Q06_04600 [Bacteroidota bacterium]|nr:hypothetical protein [Bacteroidota bacterium]
MKKIILQAFLCIFLMGCASEVPDTIIVYYLHGFVETNISKPCSELREIAIAGRKSPLVKFDTISIAHSDFAKLKDYVSKPTVVADTVKHICSIDSRIVAVYDTIAVSFETTKNKYGANSSNELVYANNEIIYLLKSLVGYYNYFDKEYLLMFFPEIKEYGIPKTYKRFTPPITDPNIENIYPLHSRIILVDSI